MNASTERFEDLRVWQAARALTNKIYQATHPLREFDFRNQIRSAAVSIMNNIAEGRERRTDADFAHFLDIAKGSAGEIRSMLYLSEDQAFVAPDTASALRTEAEQLSRGIASLAAYLRRAAKQSAASDGALRGPKSPSPAPAKSTLHSPTPSP